MGKGNELFPVFLKLESLKTLIVGGGKTGLEKLDAILKNSPAAQVILVAPVISREIKDRVRNLRTVTLQERNFLARDLTGKDLVLLATSDRALHKRIRGASRKRGILVNVADTPDLCDFYLGSVVTKGDLKIGISTNGKSPTITKRLREYLEDAIPDATQQILDNMAAIRDRIKGDLPTKVKVLNEVTSSWLKKG